MVGIGGAGSLTSCSLLAQIMENAEINNIIKIVGLQYKKSYDDPESLRSLRYGKIMIMTDQVSCGAQAVGLGTSLASGLTPVCTRIKMAPTSKGFSSTSSITTGRRS